MLTEAYELGRHAAFDGDLETDNPYPAGGRDHRRWLEGHRDARQELGGPLTCTHAARGLCPACRAEYDAAPLAYHELGDHPAGLARWRALQEEMARDAAAQDPTPPGAWDDIPF
jgi:hypothetical protein